MSLPLPILVAVIFSWAATMRSAVEVAENFTICQSRAPWTLYVAFYYTNAGVTYISTVIITLILNTAIILRLKQSEHFKLTKTFNRRFITKNTERNTSFSTSDNNSNSAARTSEDAEVLDPGHVTARSHMIRQTSLVKRKYRIK